MLTSQQKLLLQSAAKADEAVRIDEIDKTTNLIKAISPTAFHHLDGKKTPPSLRTRKFFDEPATLAPEEYASYVVRHSPKQHEIFARRNAKLLKP